MVADTTRGDYPRWIDTSAMLADPLTKVMDSGRLDRAMMTGYFDMRPTQESLAVKARNRQSREQARARAAEQKASSQSDPHTEGASAAE